MAEIRWSIASERDLRSIEEFVGRDSPLHAVAFVDRLIHAVETVAATPRVGRVVPELGQNELREAIFRGFRVVYLLSEQEVTILRVVHGARDLVSLVEREPWDLG